MVLWGMAELVLHLLGVDTLHETEKKSMDYRFQSICQRIQKEKPVFYNAFYTDSAGIFKANPSFDFRILFKRNGDYRINSDGFRGNDFKPETTGGPTVLLVGDSFVWGYTAAPITNCFSDLVQEAGYYVYNGGIPGTDPLQYLKIIKKYTPLLKPKVVAVCLYMGNDFNAVPHPAQPSKNLHYIANFGYLLGYDNRTGKYFKNVEESFAYLKKRYCGCTGNIWDYIVYKTVLGKLVYNILHKRTGNLKPDLTRKWLRDTLMEMQHVCKKNGSNFLVLLVPGSKNADHPSTFVEKHIHLLSGLQYFYPDNFSKLDYQSPPDNHFNNRGHKKFADFIIGVLKEKRYSPVQSTGVPKNTSK